MFGYLHGYSDIHNEIRDYEDEISERILEVNKYSNRYFQLHTLCILCLIQSIQSFLRTQIPICTSSLTRGNRNDTRHLQPLTFILRIPYSIRLYTNHLTHLINQQDKQTFKS